MEQTRKAGKILSGKHVYIVFLFFFLWGCACPDLVRDENGLTGQEIRPYVGLIRNFSRFDISIPSFE